MNELHEQTPFLMKQKEGKENYFLHFPLVGLTKE